MSVASASQYGPYVDLQNWVGSQPTTSGSIYLTGSAANERVQVNVGMLAPKLKLGSSTEVASVLDEDNMASDSATALATQQSIKAYVDSQVTAQDLDFTIDGAGSYSVDLDSQALNFASGEGIDLAASGQTVTISGEDASTTNKGVASFNSADFAASSGDITIKALGVSNAQLAGSIANAKLANSSVTLSAGAGMAAMGAVALGASVTVAVDGVLEDLDTLGAPSADGEFIVATGPGAFAYESGATARTSLGLGTGNNVRFTDLTLTGDLTVQGTTTTIDSTAVNIGDRIIDLNTAGAAGDSGIYVQDVDSGQTGSLLWDTSADRWFAGVKGAEVNLVTVSSTDTLTNKTLTSPDINTPDIDGGSIDGTVIGAASAAAGTFTAIVGTSLNVSDGNITNVGDIALDSISADGSELDILMDDSQTAALEIKQGSDVFMAFNTDNDVIAVGHHLLPGSNNAVDLGNGSMKWKDLHLAGNVTAAQGTYSGRIICDATDEATDATDGSIQTDGGISCRKSAVIGDDLDLLSDGAIMNIGSTSKFTLTDQAANNCVMATANHRLAFGDAGEYVSGDGNDLLLVSGRNIVATAGTFDLNGQLDVSGISQFSGVATFGADGAGVDVKAFGGTANHFMLYDASENRLEFFQDGGTTAHLTIGGDAAGEYAIDVAAGSGDAKNKIRAAAFVTYSDERLKSDVEPMRNALDTVNSLSAVNFTWKEGGARDFGFMAQDLQKVIPQAVHGTDEGMFGVDYGRLTAVLVSAIQEQSAQIKDLQAKLNKK